MVMTMRILKDAKKKKYKITLKYVPEKDEPFNWVITNLDYVQDVMGQTVAYREDDPIKGIKKSWIIPTNLIEKIEEID